MDFVASSGNRDAKGLPLTEIHEELDDDDNVISSSLSHPEASTAKVFDALKTAGLTDSDLSTASANLPHADADAVTGPSTAGASDVLDEHASHPHDSDYDSTHDKDEPERPPIRKKSVSFSADTKIPPEPVRADSEDGRKSVSFAPKVSVAPAADPPDTRFVSFAPKVEEIPAQPPAVASPETTAKSDIQKDLRAYFKPGDKVRQLNDDDEVEATTIVMPENESEDDARIRREMLEYHLNEVGHVVATMDVDEDDYEYEGGDDATTVSDLTTSEHPDEDTPYTSASAGSDDEDEDEDEDEYGRSTKRVISDKYRKEMQELERRLSGNLGPAPTDQDLHELDPEINPKDVRRLVIRDKRSSTISNTSYDSDKKAGGKKRVSFAEALDVAKPSSPPLKALKTQEGENVAPPLGHTTSERSTSDDIEDTPMGSEAPSGPPGMVIADQLMERAPKHAVTAPSIDDPDALMQRRELATEYHRRRNEMIRQQGGFKSTESEEEGLGPLMEEKDGKVKKVSRFRAARLKP